MTTTAIERPTAASVIEQALIGGDLSRLTPEQRVSYYNQVCESLGLNPLTKPFAYITLNGKLVLYALKDCTEQLRSNRNVSVQIVAREVAEDCYVVTARASLQNNRQDESIGAVSIAGLKGENRANAIMKAETKAKRRVTLSICGLGMLDESEVESIHDAKPAYVVEAPAPPLAIPPGRERETRVEPSAGASASLPVSEDELKAAEHPEPHHTPLDDIDVPAGAFLIAKVEGPNGKAKGFIHLHRGESFPVYQDQLRDLAADCCNNREPVLVEFKTSAAGNRRIESLKRAPLPDSWQPHAEPLTADDIF